LTAAALLPAPAVAATNERVSLSSAGGQLDEPSTGSSISADGRHIPFVSHATDVVAGDTNAVGDVFVRDRTLRRTVRVSVSSTGEQADDGAWGPVISRQGRWVAFSSGASNLVSGDGNQSGDVFLRDRDTDQDTIYDEPGAVSTKLVSRPTSGGTANGWSDNPAVGTGTRLQVGFQSVASNLVSNDTNGNQDVFVHNVSTSRTVRVSVSTSGLQANGRSSQPSMSPNGRYVAFVSSASNLAGNDTNGRDDVFVRDRDTDADGIFDEAAAVRTVRASGSVPSNGVQYEHVLAPAISADGRHVVFTHRWGESDEDDPPPGKVYVRDLKTGTTSVVSRSTSGTDSDLAYSRAHAISSNGRYVTFMSDHRLDAADTNSAYDAYLRDRDTDADGLFDETGAVRTRIASVTSGGAVACCARSEGAFISETGGFVGIITWASLVAGDSNGQIDVYVRTP
jgi:Tol biopolymer transport system component